MPTIDTLIATGACAVQEVLREYAAARGTFGPFHSLHEALGVIREEYVELETEIFKNPRERDPGALRKEAVQLAAMALLLLAETPEG